MKKLWLLVVVVLGVVAWGSAVAPASTDLPFHLDGSGTLTFGQNTQSGQITGTQIGRGTVSGTFTVDGSPFTACSPGGGGAATEGSQTLTANDGSTINQELVGVTCQSGPTSFRTTSTYTITGGTGRFGTATGTGSHVRETDFPNGFSQPGTFTIHQDGTINLG